MDLKWDLTSLLENNEKFYDGIAKAKKLLSDIKKYSDTELDEKSLLNILDEKWNIKELANNILEYKF